jgi:hypothetical protein
MAMTAASDTILCTTSIRGGRFINSDRSGYEHDPKILEQRCRVGHGIVNSKPILSILTWAVEEDGPQF